MGRVLSYTATSGDKGERLDLLCAARSLYPSRSVAARSIDQGQVFVNGTKAVKRQNVSPGDIIVYEEAERPVAPGLFGQAIDLDIRFEDGHLLVLSKQAGLVCHPSVDHGEGTLVHALINHCGKENLCNVQGADDRLGIVHRLDQDTTGLMLVAKTDEAGSALMKAIRDRKVDRRYLVLVQGNIAYDTGMVDAPIARSATDRRRMAVRDTESARDSMTTFTVLERFEAGPKDDGFTLIEAKLLTGRTHQIRVHAHYIKHPCVGDPVYGGGTVPMQLGLTRQFLHSYLLEFAHPVTGERLRLFDVLPADLQAALDGIANRSQGRTEAGKAAFDELAGGAAASPADPAGARAGAEASAGEEAGGATPPENEGAWATP
ncbi:MAG: RluA family pseudouridine synthase [Eggerthellaceae bacterium]|jgi:23S rRNA pseudouridine1911/1915/1917 synthase|nr:RluA family pseudouridine synthase [Eggerthellaceae bacterium]MDR2716387.1 RluA family pseudouridine synthase [Coriobacteriaceae bacterium]